MVLSISFRPLCKACSTPGIRLETRWDLSGGPSDCFLNRSDRCSIWFSILCWVVARGDATQGQHTSLAAFCNSLPVPLSAVFKGLRGSSIWCELLDPWSLHCLKLVTSAFHLTLPRAAGCRWGPWAIPAAPAPATIFAFHASVTILTCKHTAFCQLLWLPLSYQHLSCRNEYQAIHFEP